MDTRFVRHQLRGMKNVTITLDEQVAQWARTWAAREGTSVSKLVGLMLKQKMEQEQGYATAMRRALSRRPMDLSSQSGRYPTREELYDRKGLR